MKATKSEIITSVSEHSQLSKAQIKRTLNLILDHVQQLLADRGTVELRGFGTFGTRERQARDNARNPKTGEKISVQKRRVPFFRPGKEMRRIVAALAREGTNEE